jgi:hypothetical protein
MEQVHWIDVCCALQNANAVVSNEVLSRSAESGVIAPIGQLLTHYS